MDDSIALPKRTEKPREYGITIISDQGLGRRAMEDLIETGGNYIDFVKLSIGTAHVTLNLKEKVYLYQKNNIDVYFGGSLFEVYAVQDKCDAYKRFLLKNGVNTVEVSNGMDQISDEDRLRYVRELRKDFIVLSEVGCKDDGKTAPPFKWVEMVNDTIEAGAVYVIAEGRESGDAGLYHSSTEVRTDLVGEILNHLPKEKIVFETPLVKQQAYFINNVGPNVNLGNIMSKDILLLESQRLGLKYETY